MKDMIAYCGLDCGKCDAYLATINNDQALREKTAELWTKLNQAPILPEHINCEGCRVDGVKTVYCDNLCGIRQCALNKKVTTCGDCPELNHCQKIGALIANNPDVMNNLQRMSFKRTEKYNKDFLKANMMGPNSVMMLEELLENVSLKPDMRVLDLGCGNGLTSVFLAKEYGVKVFALDLWVSATDNYRRFQEAGVENLVIPIHADALDMPFANEYFDAVVSVDAYHYVGNNDTFFHEKVRPILKKNGIAAFAFPGMKYEIKDNIPSEMKPYWEAEALEMWHSIEWWRPKFEKELNQLNMWEMRCFQQAWNDWLSTDNPYAVGDREMIRTDNGRYMNLIGITGTLGERKNMYYPC